MFKKKRTWLDSRASLGQALTAIGIADTAGLELAPPSTKTLVFRYNGLVYRFATNEWQANRIKREQELLKRIASQLSCKIPEIIVESSRPVFHAYRNIEGVSLHDEGLAGLEPSRQERILTSLARFLVELHGCDTGWCGEQDRDAGSRFGQFPTKADLDHYDAIDPSGTARLFAEKTIGIYDTTQPDAETAVLLHNDFVAANILIDRDAGDVAGIIDFTEWLVGDHHWDFSQVRGFGRDDGLKKIARIYEAESGRRLNLEFVVAIERARLCGNLLRVARHGQQRIDWTLMRMRNWRPLA